MSCSIYGNEPSYIVQFCTKWEEVETNAPGMVKKRSGMTSHPVWMSREYLCLWLLEDKLQILKYVCGTAVFSHAYFWEEDSKQVDCENIKVQTNMNN